MEVVEAFSKQPKNIVIDESPFEGILIHQGNTVTVTISKGQEVVQVPNIVGLSLDDATTQLNAAKLQIGIVTRQDTNKKANTVLVVSPGQGTQLTAGSKVNLTVASGKVQVPSVIGMDVNDAVAQLQHAGFQVQQQTQTSDQTPNSVIAQSPSGGEADQGSTVTITIATAPDEPSPTPSDTSNPNPNPTDTSIPFP
jgi:serine/threonine-protein kinase